MIDYKKYRGKYAVITGASRGLGKNFAITLAQHGINPILISSNDRISALCDEIKEKYPVDCQYFVADLTKRECIYSTTEEINAKYDVFFLINNAGLGGSQRYDQVDPKYLETIVNLNVMAPTLLIRLLLDNLLRQEESYILNVASMAALTPIGYKMAYPASKAFVKHLSLSLREEFKRRGLSVSVVCPGAMATSPEIISRIHLQGWRGQLTLVAPAFVARKSIRQTLRGKKQILVNPASYIFSKIVPNAIKTPILTKIVSREIQTKKEA